MKSRPLIVFVLLMLCVGALMAGCTGSPAANPPAVVPPIAVPSVEAAPGDMPDTGTSVDQGADQALKDQSFDTIESVFKGTVPPEMSSYRYNPEAALGAIVLKVLKSNATVQSCDSTNPEDFTLERIDSVELLPGCVAQVTEQGQVAEERIVRGGVNAKVNHLVGDAGLDAKYAFEFLVTTPLAVAYPASQSCVNAEQVIRTPTLPRTCDVYFVTGATLYQVTYRQFTEVSAEAKYNALITVDGQMYGSTTFMRSYPILTVDFMTLSHRFAINEAGFKVMPTVAEAQAEVEAIQSEAPEFIIASVLPEQDELILPELSMEFLLEDPEFNFGAPIDLELVE